MRYLIFIGSALLLSSCSYFKWVTLDRNGQIINENKRLVNIIGNPQMECYNSQNQLVAKGYFVRQENDGSFLIDEFGKQYVVVENPNCLLGRND
jgi:hypothetical protein